MVVLNVQKLGMCLKFAHDQADKMSNFDRFGKDKDKFINIVRDNYLLASECEEDIKNYEPNKLQY